jgi:histidyl-tRNA synthetase
MKKELKAPMRLKGFNDFFAEDMLIRNFVTNTFKEVFEKYGYEPLETPALEYTSLMLGISGEEAEKQFYRFKDSGDRDVMLKYEVMTSMSRAYAQNKENIPLPYKRYQIQRVWRAENTQKGRYREFTQCDADTLGSLSMTADAEFIQMGIEIVGKLGFKDYRARISNRKFLEGLGEYIGVRREKFYAFFSSIDKLPKIGVDGVKKVMIDKGIKEKQAEKTLELIDPAKFEKKNYRSSIEAFESTVGKTKPGKEALQELSQIADYLEAAKVDERYYMFDPSIARGLASYTGPVWEFEVVDGGVGSIAGCGRYDTLIAKYIGIDVPATGGSFGIERICDILKDRKMVDLGETTVDVLVTVFDEATWKAALKVAIELRNQGLATMLYPEVAKIGKQFQYADRKGIPWVVVVGPDEVKAGVIQLKDMKNEKQYSVKIEEVGKLAGNQ